VKLREKQSSVWKLLITRQNLPLSGVRRVSNSHKVGDVNKGEIPVKSYNFLKSQAYTKEEKVQISKTFERSTLNGW